MCGDLCAHTPMQHFAFLAGHTAGLMGRDETECHYTAEHFRTAWLAGLVMGLGARRRSYSLACVRCGRVTGEDDGRPTRCCRSLHEPIFSRYRPRAQP